MSLKRKRVTDKVLEQAFSLVKKGKLLRDVAGELNISYTYLSMKLTLKYGAKYSRVAKKNQRRRLRTYFDRRIRERKQRYLKLRGVIERLYWTEKRAPREIGKLLGLADSTVLKIMREEGIPRREPSWRHVKQIKPQKSLLTIEKATFIAMLLTDGTEEARINRIIFINKDPILRTEFMKLAGQVYGITRFSFDKLQIRINSIAVINDIHKYAPNLKKRHRGEETRACIPIQVIHGSYHMISAFLRYVFSCDGYVNVSPYRKDRRGYIQRRVGLKCKHKGLRKQYRHLLRGLHIKFAENASGIQIDSLLEIKRFASVIGFVPEVKVHNNSKYWRGWEKNAILKLAIEYPTRHSFALKEECIESLRRHLRSP